MEKSVDKARYIKSAIQSFDGVDQVQNNLRPSTVVVRSTEIGQLLAKQ